METDRCPRCDSPAIVTGEFRVDGHPGPAQLFVPDHARFLRLREGVHLDLAGPRRCAACGHVWATLKAEELQDFLRKYGDELAKQDAGLAGGERAKNVPEVPQARRAALRVEEIDALVRAEKRSEATRRYREFTGGTWDQAINAIRGWRDQPVQKLSLFGRSTRSCPRVIRRDSASTQSGTPWSTVRAPDQGIP